MIKTFLKAMSATVYHLWNFSLGAYASNALQIADIERILGAAITWMLALELAVCLLLGLGKALHVLPSDELLNEAVAARIIELARPTSFATSRSLR